MIGFKQVYLCDTHGAPSSCCLGQTRRVCEERRWRWPSSASCLHPAGGRRQSAGPLVSPQSLSYPLLHTPCPLTSALALGVRPALRCTGGGFSPVSRGKARGSFPVSSCRGHSLVTDGRPNSSTLSPPKHCTTRRHLRKLLELSIKSTLVPRLRSLCVPNVLQLEQFMS